MVSFSFLLKLTWQSLIGRGILCGVMALFLGMVWEYAVNQSKTQIADWLENPELMLDISVILTIDVFFQATFCILSARKLFGDKMSRVEEIIRQITLWFPGLLIFPTLFAMLVEMIFSFTGVDFAFIAWTTAGGVFLLFPLLSYLLQWILPEKDLRLELMFMINALVAILGVIATVNGRTAVKGTNSVEWDSLAGILVILAGGAFAGTIIYNYRNRKLISKIK